MNQQYIDAINDIAKAAKILQACIPDEELNQPYMDSGEPFVRIPTGAFCLKMAQEVWRMFKTPEYPGGFPIPLFAGKMVPMQQPPEMYEKHVNKEAKGDIPDALLNLLTTPSGERVDDPDIAKAIEKLKKRQMEELAEDGSPAGTIHPPAEFVEKAKKREE